MQRHWHVSQSPAKVGFHEGYQRKLESDKWKTRENVGPLLNETGDLVTHEYAAFASKNSLQKPQAPEIKSKLGAKKLCP